MEQKRKIFKWLTVGFLAVGFLVYIAYLFCRKASGVSGKEYEHIGWFVVDVFMIGGALLGLLKPDRFEKLGGFCIVGLSFANLVMDAVYDTGIILYFSTMTTNYPFDPWMEFFTGLVALIAIVCIVLSLAFPKIAKYLGPAAVIAFFITGLLILIDGFLFIGSADYPWAFIVEDVAVSLITFGLAFGLMDYSFLLSPAFKEANKVA